MGSLFGIKDDSPSKAELKKKEDKDRRLNRQLAAQEVKRLTSSRTGRKQLINPGLFTTE